MPLIINDHELNLQEVNALISKNKKLEAIKYIKVRTAIGLKECKAIVENLARDPNFYNAETIISTTIPIPDSLEHSTAHNHQKKGNHIISEGSNHTKTYIILILFIVILIIWFIRY